MQINNHELQALEGSCKAVADRKDLSLEEKSEFILKKMREISALQRQLDQTFEQVASIVRPINRELRND